MQIPSISTLANQNRNSFKGFNNVLALRVTTDNGNSVKVFSCKLNNIGENDLNNFEAILNKNNYPKDVLVLKIEEICNKTPKIYANSIDITNEDPLFSIMPKNIQEQDSFFKYLGPINSILERFIKDINKPIVTNESVDSNEPVDYDENFADVEKITIQTLCGKFKGSDEAYKIVDKLVTNDLNKNGRRVLLEVANNFKNSIASAISSYTYRLIKTAMKSPY